jgi:hypothetical protein
MPILLGQKELKCPGCGGWEFAQIPTGKIKYTIMGEHVDVLFKEMGFAFLCANPVCKLQSISPADILNQEKGRGNGDAVI